jgi:hypothetical protein
LSGTKSLPLGKPQGRPGRMPRCNPDAERRTLMGWGLMIFCLLVLLWTF